MCVSLCLDGEWIESVGAATKAIGPLVWQKDVTPTGRDDVCLCGLDVEATVAANGLYIFSHDEVMWEYVLTRKEPDHVASH